MNDSTLIGEKVGHIDTTSGCKSSPLENIIRRQDSLKNLAPSDQYQDTQKCATHFFVRIFVRIFVSNVRLS